MHKSEDTKPMAIKRPFCRAKIFQPFDALPGLRELLRAKEREHENAFSPDLADACPRASGEQEEAATASGAIHAC